MAFEETLQELERRRAKALAMGGSDKLAKRKAEGKPLGRPRGAKSARLKLDTHAAEIRGYLAKGISKRSIAKLVGCAESTLYDWMARRVLPVRSSVTGTRR